MGDSYVVRREIVVIAVPSTMTYSPWHHIPGSLAFHFHGNLPWCYPRYQTKNAHNPIPVMTSVLSLQIFAWEIKSSISSSCFLIWCSHVCLPVAYTSWSTWTHQTWIYGLRRLELRYKRNDSEEENWNFSDILCLGVLVYRTFFPQGLWSNWATPVTHWVHSFALVMQLLLPMAYLK